jgi:hypothetical protein
MGHRLESVVVVERVEWGASLRPTGRPSSLAGVLGCLTAACAPTVVVAVIECPFHRTSIGGVVKNERSFHCDRITTADAGGSPNPELRTQHRRRLYSKRRRVCQAFWQIAGSARSRPDPGMRNFGRCVSIFLMLLKIPDLCRLRGRGGGGVS